MKKNSMLQSKTLRHFILGFFFLTSTCFTLNAQTIRYSHGYDKLPECLDLKKYPFTGISLAKKFANPSESLREAQIKDLKPGSTATCVFDQGNVYAMAHHNYYIDSLNQGGESLSSDSWFNGSKIVNVEFFKTENNIVYDHSKDLDNFSVFMVNDDNGCEVLELLWISNFAKAKLEDFSSVTEFVNERLARYLEEDQPNIIMSYMHPNKVSLFHGGRCVYEAF